MDIQINPKFRDLIPPLSPDEYEQLEKNLVSEGVRDALVLWGNVLIDGHNRYEIAQKHGLEFQTTQVDFDNEDDAALWIIDNQLGRRNLNKADAILLAQKRGEVIAEEAKAKQADAGKKNIEAYNSGTSSVKNDKTSEPTPIDTRKEVAKLAGVSTGTVAQFEQVQKKAPELIPKIRSGEMTIGGAYKEVKRNDPTPQPQKPHVSFNSGNNEWYTPKEIIEAARKVMGSIDIDPASSDVANEVVRAAEYYTAETDGLDKPLHGNVWMNPPYSSDLIDKFITKVVDERGDYTQAIVLVNNATETQWFSKLVSIASAVCFPRSRVRFYMPDGKTGAPLQGQAIVYIGSEPGKFLDTFREIGWGCLPYGV